MGRTYLTRSRTRKLRRVVAIPGLRNKDVINLILFKHLGKRDRQVFRCAWFPQNEADLFEDGGLAGYYGKHGDLHMVKWVLKNNNTLAARFWAVEGAARGGHLHVLEWVCEPWVPERQLAEIAGKNGHVHVLKWLFAKYRRRFLTDRMIQVAARDGYVNVLEYAANANFPFSQMTWNWIKASDFENVRKWYLRNR